MATLLGRRERFVGLAGAVGLLAAMGCSGGGGGGHSSSASTAAPITSNSPTPTTPAGLSLGSGRALHTATILKSGAIFVAGGVDSSGNAIAETSIVTLNAVVSGPRLLQPRVGCTATLLENGDVLIAGGQGAVNAQGALDTTELFDPLAGAITAGPKLSTGRSEAVAVTFGPAGSQMVLVAGGANGTAKLDSAEVYDVKGNAFTALPVKLAEPVAGAEGARLDDGTIVLVGGDSTAGPAGAEIFDPTRLTFAATNMMVRRSGGAFVASGREGYIAGGASATGVEKTTETYDIATRLFSQSAQLLAARRDGTASVVSQGLVVIGGRDASKPLNSVEVLKGATFAQSTVAGQTTLTTARYGHTATVLSGKVIVIGGFDTAGIALASIETVDPAAARLPVGTVVTAPTTGGTNPGTGTLPPAPGGSGSGLGGILGSILGGLTGGSTGSTGGSILGKVAQAGIQTLLNNGFSGGIGGFFKSFAGNLIGQFFPPTSTIGQIASAIFPPSSSSSTSSSTGSSSSGLGGILSSIFGGGSSSSSGGGIGGVISSLFGGLFGGSSSSATQAAPAGPAPSITLMTPTLGPVGTFVSITGNNLGTSGVSVTFKKKQGFFSKILGFITGGNGPTSATITSITGTNSQSTINLTVPSDADSGDVNVQTASGQTVKAGTFTVQ